MGLFKKLTGIFDKKTKTKTSSTLDSTTTGSQSDLPPELLASLQGLFQGLVGSGAGQASQDALAGRLDSLANFDPAQFASAVAAQASSAAGLQLDAGINDVLSRAGGGAGSSGAQLVANKARNETAANLGGIIAGARAQGEQILTQGLSSATDSIANQIANIIAGTRGSTVSGTLTESGKQTGVGVSKSGGGIGDFFKNVGQTLSGFGFGG